ncbi:MAG: RNA methyltransferase [Butyricicoccus sp.]|nr:RNA methyltransferase [Butyricicoccus sp.]
MQPIESKQNSALRHLARLGREKKYRVTTGEMVCEGEKMLGEALQSGVQVTTVLVRTGTAVDEALLDRAEAQGARLYTAAEHIFALASDVQTPQGIVFSCKRPAREGGALPPVKHAVLLDGLQDPGNLGAILRTADAFALDAVILCEGCTDPTAPKVVRATMGAIFRQPVYTMPLAEAMAVLRAQGLPVYAAALHHDSAAVGRIDLGHSAVIVGNEGRGVSGTALDQCDRTIMIPMAGAAESLNASVAASILIWEMTREG